MIANFILPALSLLSAFSFVNAALPTLSYKGNKFFDSNGNQFYIKGVAYQLLPADPLVDTQQCQTDAALMKQLGANTIRVYHVDPWANHDGCMQAFDDNGIYVFLDLDTFNTTVVEGTPAWTAPQFQAFAFVMDVFSKYDNTAGFYIGNEVINEAGPATESAPYIKAALTDLKAYQRQQNYRAIPIGYSHADVAGLRPALQDYFVCGGDAEQALDFFSLNCYEWCGNVDYVTSGYVNLQNQTAGYPVPVFISETGCNAVEPRTFQDQTAIFGPNMDGTWSGSIIYEWIQEENHYGLITYGGGNTQAVDSAIPAGGVVRSGSPTPIVPDFANLMTVWQSVSPSAIASAAYQPSGLTTPACPAYTEGVWQVSGNVPLPTLGAAAVSPQGAYSAPSGSQTSAPSSASSSILSASSSLSSAGSSAQSSAQSLRSSIQSTNAAAATTAPSASASGSAAASPSSSAPATGAASSSTQISGFSFGSLLLGVLMWF